MTIWLKQSTSVDLPVGPFVDSTDGFTAETALTLTQPDIRLKKNGGAWAQKAAAQTLSHEENGWYEVTLDATDTATLGVLQLAVHETGALPVFVTFMVVPANVWDSFFGADKLQVHADEITAGLITAASIAADAITDAKVASDVTIASVTGAVGSVTGAVGSIATGGIVAASFAADAITAAKVAADVGTEIGTAVWATTTRLLTAGTNIALAKGTGVTGFNDLSAAQVNAEADTALTDYDGPTNAELATALGTADDAVLAAIAALNNPSAAGIADAVWDEDATGHQTQGTFGQAIGDPVADTDTIWGLANTNLNATVSSRASQTSVDDLPTNAELATALGTADDAVLSAIATAQTGIDAIPTNAELATALGTADDAVLAQVALVKAQTDLLPSDPADQSLVIAATDAIMARLGAPAGASMSADIAVIEAQTDDIGTAGAGLTAVPWNAAWDAEVQSEVTDALDVYDGPTNAELATALAAADDAVLAQVALVKAKTDDLTFTAPGVVDANVLAVNTFEVTGDGDGTPWGPV